MSRLKETFLYILALIVLLAPAIIIGWIGLSLLGWFGLIAGVAIGLAIFIASVNKIAAQSDDDAPDASEEPHNDPANPVEAQAEQPKAH